MLVFVAQSEAVGDRRPMSIVPWVENGGVLVLFGNDKGNCEFTHLNELARRFGITFNEDKANTGGPAFGPLPDHPFFKDVKKLHIKDMCTLTLAAPAEAILTWEGQTLIATAKKGKGLVFALGDPWLYNEYINHQDNKSCARNLFKALLDPSRK
jgi:unsaturated rhamnogalacturonyl hydrolase